MLRSWPLITAFAPFAFPAAPGTWKADAPDPRYQIQQDARPFSVAMGVSMSQLFHLKRFDCELFQPRMLGRRLRFIDRDY